MGVIVWSLLALRDGQHPRCRHDGGELDERRRRRRGRLPLRGALLEFRADWQELALGLGFKPWNSVESPCFACTCTRDNMHVYSLDEGGRPYRLRTNIMYRQAVETCTVRCRVGLTSGTVLQYPLQNLVDPPAGRCLQRECVINGVRLLHGDRLQSVESAGAQRDIQCNLAELTYPSRVTFFRPSLATFISAINVLFDVLEMENIALDTLHIVDLGVAQYCASWVLVMLLLADVYNTGATTQPNLLSAGVRALRRVLKGHGGWYSRQRKKWTRINKLTVRMVLGKNGTVYRPCLRAKGAESRGMMFFARDQLRQHIDRVGTDQARA